MYINKKINSNNFNSNNFNLSGINKRAFSTTRPLNVRPEDGNELISATKDSFKAMSTGSLDTVSGVIAHSAQAVETKPAALATAVRSTYGLSELFHQEPTIIAACVVLITLGGFTLYSCLGKTGEVARTGQPTHHLRQEELPAAHRRANEIIEKYPLENSIDEVIEKVDTVTTQLKECIDNPAKLQHYPEELTPHIKEMRDAVATFHDHYATMMDNVEVQNFLNYYHLYDNYSNNEFDLRGCLHHLNEALNTFETTFAQFNAENVGSAVGLTAHLF